LKTEQSIELLEEHLYQRQLHDQLWHHRHEAKTHEEVHRVAQYDEVVEAEEAETCDEDE
jgi:hypothetical protein